MSDLREEADQVLDDLLPAGLRQTRPEGLGLDGLDGGHGGSHSFTNANNCWTASAFSFVRAAGTAAQERLVAPIGSLMRIESRKLTSAQAERSCGPPRLPTSPNVRPNSG